MALFSEYAVTPDVFNESCYESPILCDNYFRQLHEVFLSEGIVRNLRNGEWQKFFLSPSPWHSRVKHLLVELEKEGRLMPSDPSLDYRPQNDRDWCDEALASHENLPLHGIIVSEAIRGIYQKKKQKQLVESVNRLSFPNCRWWSPGDRSNSIRLKRNINEYKKALTLILRHANSIMFIDPYIDPTLSHYASFIQLLKAVGERSPKPSVEIHCKIRRGSGQRAPAWNKEKMKTIFRENLEPVLEIFKKIEILVWDDFHDRYLISNLGGILMSNGFDTSTDSSRTTWARLGRNVRDDVQREFDRTNQRLQFTFPIS